MPPSLTKMMFMCVPTSELQENTLEALRDLIRRDNAEDSGPLQKLAYVECDVHVRSLIVCHKSHCDAAVEHSKDLISQHSRRAHTCPSQDSC